MCYTYNTYITYSLRYLYEELIMVTNKTLTISDDLNARLMAYNEKKPYAKIKLSKLLEDRLDEILQEEGF